MTYLPDLRRLLLAASVAVAFSLLGVAIASASNPQSTSEPHGLPSSPGVAIDLRLAQRVALTVAPGEDVRLVAEAAEGPLGRVVAGEARLVVVRTSDGARIFDGRLADFRPLELGRVPVRERFRFAVSGTAAGRVVFRTD